MDIYGGICARADHANLGSDLLLGQNDGFGAEVGNIWDHAAPYQVEDATDTSAHVSEERLEWDANSSLLQLVRPASQCSGPGLGA
jgi:hypothetical protein